MTSLAAVQTEIEVTGVQEFLGKEIPVIEGGFGKGEKVVLVKTIAEIHEVELGEINRLINENADEFEEGIDILNLMDEEFKMSATHLGFITSNRQKYCYLLSEQGYIALVGLMRTDKAKELRKKFRREYFAMRKQVKEQQPQCMEDIIIYQMQQMKSMKQQLNQINSNALRANKIASQAQEEVKSIKDVVSLNTASWRRDTQNLINKIAIKQGGCEHINLLRKESYELLNKRFGVNLDIRLTNKRRRMALEGVSKSKIDKLNNLDVIQEDKKLIEGYVAIVKDMAIKYGI
ncbi:ORF6N domain-containing protein [Romboutsia hominis]|uniref:Gp26 protein n=1 Tax=Romboutsia hominis TaxID=1507512 RepID=A0A2P2BRG9_9FIRM|nr:ORF6N domain-containing protein [Romboutsia hominis]CEI72961.1 Gp26 protein [Romboutsia hominis]